jgi:hypothetical protein
MIIDYCFKEEHFEYVPEDDDLEKARIYIFAKHYGVSVDKAESLFSDEWISLDRFEIEFEEELKEYFRGKAYKEYLDRRYA